MYNQQVAPQVQMNLITAAMYSALASHDIACANLFFQLYREPVNPDPIVQMREANRFWRLQLGSMQVSTLAVRQNLLDDIAPFDWMRLFACEVAPVIAAFQLPRIDCTAHMQLVG